VYLDGGGHAKDVVAAFDGDRNGTLSREELRLDSDAKLQLIQGKLTAAGVSNPVPVGDVVAMRVNHGVVADEWVDRRCDSCHQADSRLNQDVVLASYSVAGAKLDAGRLGTAERDGSAGWVLRRPATSGEYYVLGHHRLPWTDSLGFLSLLGTAVGVSIHGGLRIRARRRHAAHHGATTTVYLYSLYERIWHWLMAGSILLLLWTGIEIHWVDTVPVLGFTRAVLVHNAIAAVLIANAFLSLFYHLVSQDIRQFIPPRETFVQEAIAQARYYLNGIFVGAPHPVSKSAARKLNPLQQVTYLGLLNVLIPFQVVTGVLIWGAPRWPALSEAIGGLTIITPLHSIGAWLLADFIITHVYLTTTGHTPLSNLKAMISGNDEIDASPSAAHEGGQP